MRRGRVFYSVGLADAAAMPQQAGGEDGHGTARAYRVIRSYLDQRPVHP
jgi:hypothetical protein